MQGDSAVPDFSRVAGAWQKWEDWLGPAYHSFNERMLSLAEICEGQNVLDLGCGSGQFAILESKQVGLKGKVVALDISDEMLMVARRHAASSDANNIEFVKKDMHSLPFADLTFDLVTARFSLMFVRDPSQTLREIHRVLRTGGKFVATVWTESSQNPVPCTILGRYTNVPGDDPVLPGPFRFGHEQLLPDLLKNTRFSLITQEKVVIPEGFLSGRHYVEHLLEASALWGGLLLKLGHEDFQRATDELVRTAEANRKEDRVIVPRTAWIVAARK